MSKKKWTFITSHGAVLAYIAEHSRATGIAIATALGITERSVRRIIDDLEAEGYLTKKRNGWSNQYEVNKTRPLLRQATSHDIEIGDLLTLLLPGRKTKRKPTLPSS